MIQSRFKQEAITLENLGKESNGTIPSLHAYFVDRGEFYLVQEYVDGQTLGERVRTNGLFTEAQVRQLLTDLLPILSYVHQRGIVHRDIKPENIMLRQRDKPMLIDFGAVKETMGTIMTPSRHTGKSSVIGTPGFMPVEQMTGHPMLSIENAAVQMMLKSDNNGASQIMDTLTKTKSTTIDLPEKELIAQKQQRQNLNTFFQQSGYSKNLNISQKTFPIPQEKMEDPRGFDRQLRGGDPQKPIRNRLTTDDAARLMYEIVTDRSGKRQFDESKSGKQFQTRRF